MDQEKIPAVRATTCLSCGAQVEIFNRGTLQVICPFCQTTLIRVNLSWDQVGKMAELAEDLSPFSLGMELHINAKTFTIIGRLQLRCKSGLWNEWLLLGANKQPAWLGEGSGLFYFSTAKTAAEALPAFKNLAVDKSFPLAGKVYRVSNIETAVCVASEGEIPFVVDAGQNMDLVDFVGDDGAFASIDYSDTPPTLYLGHTLNRDEIGFDTKYEKPLARQTSQELRCASCGNGVIQRNPASKTIVCESCGSANDLAGGKLLLAFTQAEKKFQLKISLGKKGRLNGCTYEVIGFLARSGGGARWEEYLLFSELRGIGWLIYSNGHWNFVRPCAAPKVQGMYYFSSGRSYKHYSGYQAKVDAVLGEFYWKIGRGESAQCADFISPPYILTSEKSHNETVWSEGEYMAADTIAQAFDITPSAPKGTLCNQPAPSISGYFITYLLTAFFALLVVVIIHLNHTQFVSVGTLQTTHNANQTSFVSEPFTLQGAHALFRIHTRSNLANDWVDVEYRLVNQNTGESRLMNRGLSYYSGSDGDGYWSEGGNDDYANLSHVTAGTYVLEAEAETDATIRPEVTMWIDVSHGQSSRENLWLLLGVLAFGPLFAGLYKYNFEKQRWSDSDHPWEY